MQYLLPKIETFTKCSGMLSIVLLSVFCSFNLVAQSSDDSFKDQLNTALKSKPTRYEIINALFTNYRNDSIKMKDLAEKAKSVHNLETQSYALNSLGAIYRNVSLYEKSLKTHQEAYELATTAKNLQLQAISLNMVGVVYRRMDLIKPALDYHKRALDLANSASPKTVELKHTVAVSQNSMGNIYLTLEQYDLAISQFEKSLVIEQESNNRLGLAINYQNLGYADEAKGLLEAALKNYKRSLDYNNQIDSEVGRVICYNSIGQVYIKQQHYEDAIFIIEEALKGALKLGDQFYIALSYINLGWVQNKMNLDKEAEDNLNMALTIAKNYNLKSSIVDAHEHLSELYRKQGKYQLAMDHYEKSVALEKTIHTDRNMQYVSDIIIQYENEAKNDKIRELASENESVKFQLERNQKIFWFTMLALAIIAGIIIGFNRNRQLKQEKQILTLEQDMLRSQMNPHFIFNSLNSIKLYIINNEKENAVYYLNKFSKLIRKILIASTEKEITLEDELDTMKLYMNIENIRFSNEIDFNIEVDNSIKSANIKVPSLILQPFLENSLWHGLSSKKEDKKIDLHVSKTNDDYVTITITDNGIGRQASGKINRGKILKRKSVGISITKARLANFSKGYTNDYNIRIDDLHDNIGNPTGTKVVVNIPTRSNVLKIA